MVKAYFRPQNSSGMVLSPEASPRMQKLHSPEERYRFLASLNQIINSTLDLRQVFRRAAKQVQQLTGCDRVSLLLVDPPKQTGHGYALEFPRIGTLREIAPLSLTDTAAEWVLRHGQPRAVLRLDQDRSFLEEQQLLEQGYHASLFLPLTCRNQVLGVLGLATRQPDRPGQWDAELLQALGIVLATALDNALAYTQIARLKAQLEAENIYLRDEMQTEHHSAPLIGGGAGLRAVRQAVGQVAPTDSTVLIVGETGTGKELIARAIHEQSPRRGHLLVKVNCAALAPGLITSELFGHEAGAFTGATKRRIGRFELAHQGSIFLDEVAEVPPETQVLLLRTLQERVIERAGGNEAVAVDVRVIAATNRDLTAAVAAGGFRSDLFYRLNVFPIHVPPLRERREDIPDLVSHFLRTFGQRMNKHVERVDRHILERLQKYPWPGNVRELENIIERALIVARGDTLEIDPTWLRGPHALADDAGGKSSLAETERRTILEALARSGGKIYGPGGAAEALGLKPTTLYGKMRKHRISKKAGTFHFDPTGL